MRQPVGRNAPALVRDRDRDMHAVARRRDPDGDGLRRVPGGVGEQVVEHLHDAPSVGHHTGQVRRQVDEHAVPPAAGEEGVARPVHQHGNLGGLGRDRERARLDPPDVEQVADEAAHLSGLVVDDAVELPHLGRLEVRRVFQQRGGGTPDRGERGAQFVAHQAEELGALPLKLVERLKILNGHHHGCAPVALGRDRGRVDQRAHAAPARRRDHDLLGA